VSAVTLATAGFAATVQAGTFTVNGRQVAIATTDTLQQVFDKIAAATNNDVAASYDPNSDRITLASVGGSEIVLGSATDTSNFLQVARLANNGTGTITSTSALGGIRLTAALDLANFATAVSDGGGGAGEFRINGVSIAFSADTDTVNDVIARINNSAAGVTASYDSLNDRFLLTSKATGDLGIALEDVTGNFLAAAGLSSGTLARGNDLTYSINGGDTLTSRSNTITADSSGIAGVSVTALKENSTVTVTVNSDTSKVRTAITDFLEAYNAVQSYIDTQSASSTSPAGKVTAGLLANDSSAREISSSLRRTVFQAVAGLSETIDHLADLGIQTSGYDNKLTLSDSDRLDAVLANDLNSVKRFFSDATSGLAVQFDSYLTRTMGEGGILTSRQESLTRAASNIDDQIASMEKVLEAHKQQMIAAFTAMEEAQARINQQLAYLTNQFAS
jgi:flagellar hook-associated protein 2